MSDATLERLYNLLPVLYRQRDLQNDESLRALLSLLEIEYRTLESDISAGYDNWFIQTCDKWVIPYLAELVGMDALDLDAERFPTRRRQVANTIGYRRRKGTPAVLDHVLRDASGWSTHAVEFFKNAAMTQHVSRIRLDRGKTVDLHDTAALAAADGPFDPSAHMADVHRHFPEFPDEADRSESPSRFPIHGIGLFFWRLRSYRMRDCPPHFVKQTGAGRCYTFDPLGRNTPLFNYPQLTTGIAQPVEPVHVPLPLRRAEFAADLLGYWKSYHDLPEPAWPVDSRYYGPARGLNVCIVKKSASPAEYTGYAISPMRVISADLSHWDSIKPLQVTGPRSKEQAEVVAVDVELGRMVWLDSKSEGEPIVTYCYGFGNETGGGPYHRRLPSWLFSSSIFRIDVASGLVEPGEKQRARVAPDSPDWPHCVPDLQRALDCWDEYCEKRGKEQNAAHDRSGADHLEPPKGVIRIIDNGIYEGEVVIKLPTGAQLVLIADNGTRPVIYPKKHSGNIIVECVESSPSPDQNPILVPDRRLLMNGILVQGGLQVWQPSSPEIGGLQIALEHSTLAPPSAGLKLPSFGFSVDPPWDYASRLSVTIDHSIVGPIRLAVRNGSLTVSDSIVDSGSRDEVAIGIKEDSGAREHAFVTTLARASVFGRVQARQVAATDVIFTGRLSLRDLDEILPIRHCYVPPDSHIPHDVLDPSVYQGAPPRFTSTHCGVPGYGQLSIHCPAEIRTGALNGGEMGVFHDLYHTQAEANARAAIEEYLPLDQDYGIFFVT